MGGRTCPGRQRQTANHERLFSPWRAAMAPGGVVDVWWDAHAESGAPKLEPWGLLCGADGRRR
ncbi:MAG: hypothetical protein AMXMBFR80_28410 [Dehalococcoidia bacterium]